MARRRASTHSQQQKITSQRNRARNLHWLRIGGLILIVAGGLAVLGFYRSSTAPKVDAPLDLMAANIDGPVDAPVRIVEFGDFGCPSCRAWHNSGIKEALKSEFGEQISFTFRHFPVITRQSPKAAEAGQCASEQSRFWEYHDFIYEMTPINALSVEQLKGYAASIGLDSDQFNQCLDSGKYQSYVARDQQAAFSAGAAGTPTFFINGRISSFSYEGMLSAIVQLLGQS
ncbi:MAG TPA: thioredoxin domain-containing protein [candidate division Zixibacteria bacterium]|nr:thioredoxin domain-containing protein [candidate division Zixibacteria bacterium]